MEHFAVLYWVYSDVFCKIHVVVLIAIKLLFANQLKQFFFQMHAFATAVRACSGDIFAVVAS